MPKPNDISRRKKRWKRAVNKSVEGCRCQDSCVSAIDAKKLSTDAKFSKILRTFAQLYPHQERKGETITNKYMQQDGI